MLFYSTSPPCWSAACRPWSLCWSPIRWEYSVSAPVVSRCCQTGTPCYTTPAQTTSTPYTAPRRLSTHCKCWRLGCFKKTCLLCSWRQKMEHKKIALFETVFTCCQVNEPSETDVSHTGRRRLLLSSYCSLVMTSSCYVTYCDNCGNNGWWCQGISVICLWGIIITNDL